MLTLKPVTLTSLALGVGLAVGGCAAPTDEDFETTTGAIEGEEVQEDVQQGPGIGDQDPGYGLQQPGYGLQQPGLPGELGPEQGLEQPDVMQPEFPQPQIPFIGQGPGQEEPMQEPPSQQQEDVEGGDQATTDSPADAQWGFRRGGWGGGWRGGWGGWRGGWGGYRGGWGGYRGGWVRPGWGYGWGVRPGWGYGGWGYGRRCAWGRCW